MTTLRLWLLLGVVVGAWSCTCGGPTAPPCTFDVDCASGQVCSSKGTCEVKPKCPDVACATGQQCVSGSCYSTTCGSKACGQGQVCSAGACVDEPCIGASCTNGQVCVKGGCFTSQCSASSCTPQEICVADTCTPRSCVGVVCPADQRCAADGQCHDRGGTGGSSGTVGTGGGGGGSGTGGAGGGGSTGGGFTACSGRCSPLQVCISNQCVEARCVGVVCSTGSVCAQGLCASTDCGGVTCPAGQACSVRGTCADTACVNAECPAGYGCAAGLCFPQLSDGGVPLLPDGGPAVVFGSDGGIVGVIGADGGLSLLPDGGVAGGPCLPSQCAELDCLDGIDNDSNGLTDCEDPACSGQRCDDGDPCTFFDSCGAGTCRPAYQLSCTTPPVGPCFMNPGLCMANLTCSYPLDLGKDCGGGLQCLPSGSCGTPTTGGTFPFTPSNFDPGAVGYTTGRSQVPAGGVGTIDTSTGTISGSWLRPPIATQVTTANGPALVIGAEQIDVPAGATLRITGDKPVIFAALDTIDLQGTIDVSAVGQTPGPGGNLNCATSAGSAGGAASNTASGGGGGGSRNTPGGNGGGGSLFSTGGAGGVSRAGGPTALLGGCNGGPGGNSGGLGGAGGGVVQFSAAAAIQLINAVILANGSGGKGGPYGSGPQGGGGAGGGGTIIFESVYVFGQHVRLVANGGGGGEGAGWYNLGGVNSSGSDGVDGMANAPYSQAPGGYGHSINGGNGGSGGAYVWWATSGTSGTTWDNGLGSLYEASGGGGGGALGSIYVSIVPGGMCVMPLDYNTYSPVLSTNSPDRCYN